MNGSMKIPLSENIEKSRRAAIVTQDMNAGNPVECSRIREIAEKPENKRGEESNVMP
jgi:hypothetical protein